MSTFVARNCRLMSPAVMPSARSLSGSSETSHPADARHAADALDALQGPYDRVVDEPGKLLLGQRGRLDGIRHDRQAGDIEPLDDRVVDSLRQLSTDPVDRVLDLVRRAVEWDAELELQRGRGTALDDIRDDVLDPGDARDRVLDLLRDLCLELGRRRSGLRDRYRDYGDVDVGKARLAARNPSGVMLTMPSTGVSTLGKRFTGKFENANSPSAISTMKRTSDGTGFLIAQAETLARIIGPPRRGLQRVFPAA